MMKGRLKTKAAGFQTTFHILSGYSADHILFI